MKKFLLSLLSLSLFSPTVFAQEQESFMSVGNSLSEEQITELKSIFEAEDIPEENTLTIDGDIINKYLNDGSSDKDGVYSSSFVTMLPEGSGLTVVIKTPDNITKVNKKTYENAAISAGAKDAIIQIGSTTPVSGEGALAGVYEIFSQAGLELDKEDIQTAEQQIKIEQLLAEETELTEQEIATVVAKINIEVIDVLEENEEASEQEIEDAIVSFLKKNDYDFEAKTTEAIIEHGIGFSKSSVALDPATKESLLSNIPSDNQNVGQKFEQGNIAAEISDVYLTDKRNEYADQTYKNVLILEYTLFNNSDKEYYTGNEFTLYVDGAKADNYLLLDSSFDSVSAGRQVDCKIAFGFDGPTDNMELELKDTLDHEGDPVIIPLENIEKK